MIFSKLDMAMVRIFLRGGAVIGARLAHWKCEHSDGRITRFTDDGEEE